MNNSTQRPIPSSPNLQADNHEGAGEGLDVTACSASSISDCVVTNADRIIIAAK